MESTTIFSILLSDMPFVVIVLIMIAAFVFGMYIVNRWLFRNTFMVLLGVIVIIQAVFYFYNILPHSTVDDQLASLLHSWLTSGLAG